ncbi:MAG: chemotaxis protein CheC [Candidatus Nanoarchaeia archaeon]
MDRFKEIITAFAKQYLGGIAGEILLEDYAKKFNISDLSMLTKKEQQKFIDAFLWGVFHRHLPPERINSLRLQLNLHFCIDNATEAISGMLGKKILLKPLDVKSQTFDNFEKIINNLGEGVIVIPVKLSGYITATLLIFIFRDSAITLGNIMLKSMLGIDKTDEFLDEMKQSAIKEFFNILIPTFADTIANTLKQEIFIDMPETDITDSQKQIDTAMSKISFSGDENYGIKNIISTPLGIYIDDKHYVEGMGFLLMESASSVISQSIEKTGIKKDDTLEQMDLQQIEIPKDTNRYRAITTFLNNFTKDDSTKIIDNLMDDLGISSLNNVSVGLRRKLINRLLEEHFSGHSPKVYEFIQKGCERIFNIGTKAAEDEGQQTQEDSLSKMLNKVQNLKDDTQ